MAQPLGTALRPPGRPPLRRNGPPLSAIAAGIPSATGTEPSPVGRTLGGARTGPAIPAPPSPGAGLQGAEMMMAMRQALARAIAARQKGVRRG
jgi:hypothetical protein